MPKYRKKPIVVEAKQWWKISSCFPHVYQHTLITAESKNLPRKICEQCGRDLWTHGKIATLEGEHIVCPGDWIITGVAGEYYPCKPSIFEQTYELVED